MTIAVAHDDSPEGHAALVHAAREAAFRQTALAVLHVFTSTAPAEGGGEAALRQRIGESLAEAGHASLAWRLHAITGDGTRAESLVELTEQVAADLLVVGSRRRTPIGKFLLGSTVQRVILESPVPVLVVKAAATRTELSRLTGAEDRLRAPRAAPRP
jgi:nucleotide-binding universal stress UspA family protein